MPQLIALALVGAGLYAGYRWVSGKARAVLSEAKRAESEARRRAAEVGKPKDLGELEFDPASGVYRPKRQG